MDKLSRFRKILIVDDDPDVSDFLVELIKMRHVQWAIETAKDGFTAGRKLGEYDPDLVILDLMLPGIDGFGVCRMIREDSALTDVKVLAITGYDSEEMRNKILNCGADDYLAKPMDNNVRKKTRSFIPSPLGVIDRG